VNIWACTKLTRGHCKEHIIVYVGLLELKLFTLKPKKPKGHIGLKQNDSHHIIPTTGMQGKYFFPMKWMVIL
jgi:hypothetical protein